MKKKLLVSLILASSTIGAVYAVRLRKENYITGHTFFTTRPFFQTAMPERVSLFRPTILDSCCNGYGGAMQLVAFGGKSLDNRDLARYFLPGGCVADTIRVVEFNPQANPLAVDGLRGNDVEARHFNIETNTGTFKSLVRFCPNQEFIGLGFAYMQRLSCWDDGATKWWAEISAPLVHVKNCMTLQEEIIDDGGGAKNELGLDDSPRVGTMREAFMQSNWKFGRIDGCADERTRLGDIEVKLGYNYGRAHGDRCSLSSCFGIVIPTGNTPNGHKVFQAIVGNNHHAGFFLGNSISFDLKVINGTRIYMKLDSNSRYLFENDEVRTFDLVGKPWSRYMEVYRNQDQATLASTETTSVIARENLGTSGINVFTRCVKVMPRFSLDFNTAFLFDYELCSGMLLAEIGLNFFARQAERIEANCKVNTHIALKGVNGNGQTTFARTIRDNFAASDVSLPTYATQDSCELDLNSAAHPATLSHIFYATIGYQFCNDCPALVSIGGSYEDSTFNTALSRWMVWGKYALTF